MLRLLGLFTVFIFISCLLYALNFFTAGNFINTFIIKSSLNIMGLLLGLNMAAAASLIGSLTNIELTCQKRLFDNSITEVKHNLLLMLFLFGLNFIFLTLLPEYENNTVSDQGYWFHILQVGSLVTLVSFFYALFEMIKAMFVFRNKVTENF